MRADKRKWHKRDGWQNRDAGAHWSVNRQDRGAPVSRRPLQFVQALSRFNDKQMEDLKFRSMAGGCFADT